ncbi:MAG: hypothetical protein R2798_06740 [Chitinophagales bacterium]|nr:hypothetical protein [Bacteroidota bacterium]MCB9043672.1 hypothetical protein [Chitinophagales bacterium]
MIPSYRKAYNEAFSDAKYRQFIAYLDAAHKSPVKFRVSETPVFLPDDFVQKLLQAGEEIIDTLVQPDFAQKMDGAIPPNLRVPNEDKHTTFLAFDYAICEDENGALTPKLIELQGFPSLYYYQVLLANAYRKFQKIPDNTTYLFSNLSEENYLQQLNDILLNGYAAENVILLEIEPHKQNTAIDFYVTEHYAGIRAVCISEIIREGKKLYYMRKGKKIRIRRIYNRVIFDELLRRDDLPRQFNLTEPVDIEWAGHPNWFFKISKYTMPHLHSSFVPESKYLSQFETFPENLSEYVLKPLFSFSGQGVVYNVTPEDIAAVPLSEYSNYMLQKKIAYKPVVEAPDGLIKVEVRVLYWWKEGALRPEPVVNLARLSRGEMIGVRYNKDKTWVGGSIGFLNKSA